MPKIVKIPCVILLVCVALQLAVAEPKDPGSPPQTLESLKFLAGSWQGPWPGAGDFVAHYSTPEHGKILSYSELQREGKRLFYEFEKFEVVDGVVTYTPFPGGNMSVLRSRTDETNTIPFRSMLACWSVPARTAERNVP